MPTKYQPDFIFLRHVKAIRVHCFTIVQLICFALMWIIKTIKLTSIAFPLMVCVAYNNHSVVCKKKTKHLRLVLSRLLSFIKPKNSSTEQEQHETIKIRIVILRYRFV